MRTSFGTLLLALCAAVVWVAVAGKDIGWDLHNHQLYLPFSLLSGRFATDLYAAGPQSYQNPLGYLPFFALAMSSLPSWLVGVLLTVVQAGPVIGATMRLSTVVWRTERGVRAWSATGLALALSAPILLYVIGSSSTDAYCAAGVLAGLAAAIDERASLKACAVGGIALGLAVAVKPTAAALALPIFGLVVLRLLGRRWTLRQASIFTATCALTFALLFGPWAWWLWTHFGNPVFPLFNQLFGSPYGPLGNAAAVRFLPESPLDLLLGPWRFAQFKPFTMVEGIMPDARPLLAATATLVAAVVVSARHGPRVWFSARTWQRADVQLVLFLAVAYALWMATSGNARYAIAWFVAAGVVLARVVHLCSPHRGLVWVLATLGALQLLVFVADGEVRPLSTRWDDRRYLPAEVPRRLVEQPFLHLSIGVQSNAGIAPFLHPAGAFVSLKGQLSLPADGPLGQRVRELLSRWQGRTRVLFTPPIRPGSARFTSAVEAENWAMSHRFGLIIDTTDCETVRLLPPAPGTVAGSPVSLSCGTIPRTRADPGLDAQLAAVDRLFTAIESACPRVYGPRPFVTDYAPKAFWRQYMNSDVRVDVSLTEGVVVSHFRGLGALNLGSVDQVTANHGRDACLAWNRLATR